MNITLEDRTVLQSIINSLAGAADHRRKAVCNTHLYLSLVSELDVYVATSMRERQDFLYLAGECRKGAVLQLRGAVGLLRLPRPAAATPPALDGRVARPGAVPRVRLVRQKGPGRPWLGAL
jgi:hypothetical protein